MIGNMSVLLAVSLLVLLCVLGLILYCIVKKRKSELFSECMENNDVAISAEGKRSDYVINVRIEDGQSYSFRVLNGKIVGRSKGNRRKNFDIY